ncbi:hypothetical protein, partial [Caballeronia pedi]|uniref:hypothetical protein n=1 Tax=Caballeronia pedi TaxID=1777141 RepID=UPI0011785932
MNANLIILKKGETPAGSRWITINGGDGEGQHVLIKPREGGGAEIVGGAGGALDGKKLPPKG